MKFVHEPRDPAPDHVVDLVWRSVAQYMTPANPEDIASRRRLVREVVDRAWREGHGHGRAWQSAHQSTRYLVVTQEEKDAFEAKLQAEEG